MAQKERVAPVAVITGASSGLGAVFARIAAREGYRPVLVARRQQRLEALAAEIETASGLKPWVLALDLTESAELSRLMDFLETRSVTPEIFINNAGFGDFGPMVDADEERISRMLRLNIAALTGLSIEAARAMKRLGRGRILNVASTAAFQACPGFGVYAATKAYVVSFTESLSEELRGTGYLLRPSVPARQQRSSAKLRDSTSRLSAEFRSTNGSARLRHARRPGGPQCKQGER